MTDPDLYTRAEVLQLLQAQRDRIVTKIDEALFGHYLDDARTNRAGAHPHPTPLSILKRQHIPRPGDVAALFAITEDCDD